MKNLFIPACIGLLIWSCTQTHQVSKSTAGKIQIADSTEYEITIIDPDFDQWYFLNYSQAKDYSNEYYRSKNQVGVSNWNEYFNQGKYHRVIENFIFINPATDYGIEVNRKLYWYFKYVEENYRVNLFR